VNPRCSVLLTRRELATALAPADYLRSVEAAFRALATGRARVPAPLHLPCGAGGFHAKAAFLPGEPAVVALKLNGNFPGNPVARGLPTIQGALLLCDAADGSLLAIMDSIEITLRRTAAASVLAAQLLALPRPEAFTICGCGAQGRAHAEAFTAAFALRRGFAWDADPARAEYFARDVADALGIEMRACRDLATATRDSRLVLCCSSATRAFLEPGHVEPGTFIGAVGADSPAKSEIAPQLMAAARVVPDSLAQCLEMGDLRHAVAAGRMRPTDVHAELGAILEGTRPGRRESREIFVFDSTGLAVLDAACAAEALRAAAGRGLGAMVNLGVA